MGVFLIRNVHGRRLDEEGKDIVSHKNDLDTKERTNKEVHVFNKTGSEIIPKTMITITEMVINLYFLIMCAK